ncbi:MAG: hypothetical protein HY556_06245 [Euryarchaeota archaeon]|nr:hypothetical protein [Euryarchaeota archaeon]
MTRAVVVVALFVVSSLSGCVVIDRVNELFQQWNNKPVEFRDVVEATMQGSFNVDPNRIDPTRPPGSSDDAGVRDSRTFEIAAGARVLRMTVDIGFDNDAPTTPTPPPVPPQYVNLTLASPSKVERNRLYTADTVDSFSTTVLAEGAWTVSLVAVGAGKYTVLIVVEEPDAASPVG